MVTLRKHEKIHRVKKDWYIYISGSLMKGKKGEREKQIYFC